MPDLDSQKKGCSPEPQLNICCHSFLELIEKSENALECSSAPVFSLNSEDLKGFMVLTYEGLNTRFWGQCSIKEK